MPFRNLFLASFVLATIPATYCQMAAVAPPTPLAASAPTAVPALIPYAGIAENNAGKPLTGEMLMTFSLYKDEQGGEALWVESQTVLLDAGGHYKVQLGASASSGLPLNTFASGEGRWLETQIAGQKEQPRVLLMSVPYAMKAADAETLGGLPASAYALAGSVTATNALTAAATAAPNANATVTTTGGTTGFLPKFTAGAVIGNSLLSETGASIGVGTTSPLATLDVNGTLAVRGNLGLVGMGYATSSTPYLSQPLDFITSAYSSTTRTPDFPTFQLQGEPTGNNTTSPGATLNLLYTNGGTPAETGLSISSKGILKFAAGQTFPGTGAGTLTGVTAGTDLLGGGTSGNVTVSLDTTRVPQLAANNVFTGSNLFNGQNQFVQTQTIDYGNLALPNSEHSGTGAVTIGGVPYLSGFAPGQQNVFVGNAGSYVTTGSQTTAAGWYALAGQTSATRNTAIGVSALALDTAGGSNTAIGYNAGVSAGTLSNTTALGANATVSQPNTLVLGNTSAGKPGAEFVNVGIGTDTPNTILEASVNAPGAIGPTLLLSNPAFTAGTAVSIDFSTTNLEAYKTSGPSSRIEAINDGLADSLYFMSDYFRAPPLASYGPQVNMVIAASGQVTVGAFSPNNVPASRAQLTAVGSQDSGGTGLTAFSATGGSGVNVVYHGVSGAGDGGDFVGGFGPGGGLQGDQGAGGNGGSFIGGNSALFGGDGGMFFGGTGGSVYTASGKTIGQGGDGIYAQPGGDSDPAQSPGNAATLNGNVSVTGTLTAATKDFKIDHPSDPANKYLYHASVESSEMMDIYSGNVVTDNLGIATVTLPAWFQSLNADFRYQLTTIGRDAHAWISQEVADGRFVISTNATVVKVSWQITAVRQDAYAKAHPLVVEQAKPESERGYYMHPELYGQPAEKQTEWGRHPEQMKRTQAQRAAQKLQPSNNPVPLSVPASAVHRTLPSHAAPALKPVASNAAPALLAGGPSGK